jgi:twitching motility protein PilT
LPAAIQELLQQLALPGVTELALASGRLPCIKDGGVYVPVAQHAIDDATLLSALVDSGGGAAVNALSEKPASWTSRVPGLGVVTAVAVRRGDVVQARFVLTTREAVSAPAAVPAAARAPAAIPAPPPSAPRPPMSSATSLRADAPVSSRAASASIERERELDLVAGPIAGNPQPARRRTPLPGEGIASAARPSLASSGGLSPSASPAAASSANAANAIDIPEALAAILAAARSKGATDVHLVADRLTTFRIAGSLMAQAGYVAGSEVASMLDAIVPARLAPSLLKTGSCDFALHHRELGRFRVNVARQRSGLKGCFRLISREIPQLTQLGLPLSIAEATHHHQGLILLTGPTGSGKSTTLAALVDILNRDTTHHIVSIEDPIEHLHGVRKALLSQREVGAHTKSFEAALKAALREDPDVIVVGELRDAETVRMALTASETGHLVLATMNTPSAAKTIERLIDLFPPADQGQVRMTLAGGLRLIVGQRLVPSLQGGMVAASEMLPGCVPLWSLIRENRTFQIPSLQQRGKQLGIIRLDDQLLDLVRGGRIAMEAARFVSESPESFGK